MLKLVFSKQIFGYKISDDENLAQLTDLFLLAVFNLPFSCIDSPFSIMTELLNGIYEIKANTYDHVWYEQLRGRSGRQGDPGSSRFFLSLEDNIFRIFGGDRIQVFIPYYRLAAYKLMHVQVI